MAIFVMASWSVFAQETAVSEGDDPKAEAAQVLAEEKAAQEVAEDEDAAVRSPRAVLVKRFEGCESPANSVAFSPDGKFLLAASGGPGGDNAARIWNIETGRVVRALKGHTDRVKQAV